jgi:hypothetical protein
MKVTYYQLFVSFLLTLSLPGCIFNCRALDIGPMTWTPRSDWINVKTCSTSVVAGTNAVGDGVADDTAALQTIFTWLQAHSNGRNLTVYFPPGTYKITSTLVLTQTISVSLLGCGSNTIMNWAGPAGGAMFQTPSDSFIRHIGFVWEGNNRASCAYLLSPSGSSPSRFENVSFKDFTAPATFPFVDFDGKPVTSPPGPPTAAILAGNGLSSEVMIYNCLFTNCTTGVIEGWRVGNNFMWQVDGCEFDNCGTGINFFTAACFLITNTHFEHSKIADIIGGHQMRVRHCTSSGSGYFYSQMENVPFSPDVIQDCKVDGWTNPAGAIFMGSWGPNMIFDCTFTHPPSGAKNPVRLDHPGAVILANNLAPGLPGIDQGSPGGGSLIANLPAGQRVGVLASASQTFLKTTFPPDSTHILDVTLPPYSADNKYGGDASPGIQAAVRDAEKAHNGSIVYIPNGIYKMTSTVNVSGGNYSIQGAGFSTELCWFGPENGTMFSVSTPHHLSLQLMRIAGQDGTLAGIKETSSGPSDIVYDEINFDHFATGNPGAIQPNNNAPGLVLSHLPAGAKVYMPHVNVPLTVQDCGAAQILCNFLQGGAISVSGIGPKTGFLGAVIGEIEQVVPADYNIVVDDNQDLIIGDYYTEQCANDVSLLRGNGTGSGRVTIQGLNSASGNNNGTGAPTLLLNVNNYQGSVFYSSLLTQDFNGTVPVQINQTGANPIDLMLVGNVFIDGVPKITTEKGANLISTQNVQVSANTGDVPENPNPLTPANNLSLVKGIDHLRQLEAVDLSVQYGITADKSAAAQDAQNP